MSDSPTIVFGGFEDVWESTRVYICQSRMGLWVGLQSAPVLAVERRDLTRAELLRILRAFPESTNGCRCRDCRYARIYGAGGASNE